MERLEVATEVHNGNIITNNKTVQINDVKFLLPPNRSDTGPMIKLPTILPLSKNNIQLKAEAWFMFPCCIKNKTNHSCAAR